MRAGLSDRRPDAVVLVDESGVGSREFDSEQNSICPYCGVGCQITYKIRDGEIAYVEGAGGPANENRLCVKGRFGFDYISSPERLTVPLIRKARRCEKRTAGYGPLQAA